MDKLPKGWRKSYVEDVALNIQYGYTGKTIDNGEFRYLRITDIQNNEVNWDQVPFVKIDLNESKKYILKGNDIVFARTGATAGKSFLIENIDIESVFVSYLIRIIPDLNKIYPKYLYLYFQSPEYWLHILGNVEGAAQPNFNGRKLARICFPLPPLPEQTRIVNKLDSLFERIDKSIALLEENIKHTEALMASVLDEVLTSSKDSIEISKLVVKTENVNPQNNPEVKHTYIDISSVNNKTHIIENPSELPGKDAPSRARKSVIKGDIVFATTRPNLRNIAVVDSDYLNPIASTGFCVLRANSGASKDFLFLCLLSNNIQEQIKPFIRGAQYPAISDKDLLQCKIPKLNIEEQIKVSDKVMRIREKLALLSSEQQSKLSYLKTLKASLLDKAFKGEL